MVTPSPPQLPTSPPTEWPAAPHDPPGTERGWLAPQGREREAWTGWQVAVVTVVALLAGLAVGVAIGLRIGDDGQSTALRATDSAPPLRPTPTTRGDEILGDHLGSPSNPVPMGTTFILGGYSLEVLAADPDAGATIVAESDLNVAPRPNQSYLLVTVELSYDGPYVGNPLEVLLSTQDLEGSTYLEFRDSCGRIPEPLSRHAEMDPGTAVTGNVCFAVPTDQVEGMVLVAEVLAGYPVHYRLDD